MSKPSHQPPGPRSGRIASMQALGAAASGVRWGWLIAALLLALLATALASLQSLNPHPLLPATPWERLRYPWELNAPERLPLVPSRLTSISVIPAQASDCDLSGAGPSAPPRIWAVGGAGAIVHSPDGGITWEPRNSHVDQGLAAVHFDCKGLVGQAVGDGGTLLVTQDGGALWTQARVDGAKLQDDLWAMTFPIPTQPDIGWASGAGGVILKTTDAGLSWQRQRSGTPRQIESLTFDPDGQRGWAMLGNGELLGTADGGAHWAAVAAVSGISPTEIRVVPDSGQVWMVGRLEPTPVKPGAPADAAQPVAAFARIEPGTAAPVAATPPAMVGGSASGREGGVPRLTSLHIGSHGAQAWAIGASGQVITSTDSGAHWQAQASGVTDRLIALTFWDDNVHGWALGMDGIIIATTNGGRSWTTLTHGDQHSLNDVWFTPDAQRGWAVGPGGRILASTDRGRTWHTQDSGVSTGLNRVRFLPDGLHGWIAGNAGTLLRSVDGGLSWQARRDSADAASGRAAPADLHGLAFQRDGLKGWAVGDRATWLTTDDGGQRWYAEGALPLGGAPCSGEAAANPHLNDIAFSVDGQTGWIVGRDQTVLVSQDAGQRWRRLCAGSTASGAPAYPNAAAPALATLRALHVV
ncbi:MAG: WD40/YVTN/BNR-like repeat-containing protein, partial [Leptothrix sp. (in: b-proteobacteria)]